jgi:peptidoglycan/LPS O-acetylase OafA/YrhL
MQIDFMKPKLDIIQLLRAVAAMLVCFFHMKGLLKEDNIGKILFGNGSIGVPLFFMISGFIMHHTTRFVEPNWKNLTEFLGKRLIRIVPLYVFMSTLYILCSGNGHFYFIEHPRLLLPTLFFFPTYANHIGPSYGMPALAVGWSLNYEVYFYVLIGLSMMFGKQRWLILTGWLLVFTVLIPLLSNGFVMMNLSEWYGYSVSYLSLMTNPVLLFFLAGIGVSSIYNSTIEPPSLFWSNAHVGLAVLVFVLSYFQVIQLFPGWFNHILSCGFLLFSFMQRNKIKAYTVPRFLMYIGNSSFSLYLVHPIILNIFPKILLASGLGIAFKGWIIFAVLIAIILIIAEVCARLIERGLSAYLTNILLGNALKKNETIRQ